MYRKYIKRILDFFIAILSLPFLLILIIIVGFLIIIDDGFPIFYNAKRIGNNGKLFKMYKFRTMKNNSPDIRFKDGSTYNSENDPRVTRVGKILRKASIDELPQFLNVLKGDMSFVGPRPDPPDWLEKYSDDIKVFLTVRPGITGYSQAYYRNSVDGYEKMKNDAFYATHCTFWLDIKVIFKTIKTVFKYENTYKESDSSSNSLGDEELKMINKLKGNEKTNK